MVTGLTLPSDPNWTSISPCQQYSEESEVFRIPSSNSVSLEAWCKSWQMMVHRTRLAGPCCFPGGPQGHGEQNCRNSMWKLLVLQSLPLSLETSVLYLWR